MISPPPASVSLTCCAWFSPFRRFRPSPPQLAVLPTVLFCHAARWTTWWPIAWAFRSAAAGAGAVGLGTAQHCILSIGVHIARYMKLLHLARNMHLARIARNMHDSVICADCARHAPVMQNYDRFLALRAMCTSSKFTIVRNMRIVSKWAYCAPCAWRYAHYMHICQNPPDRVCTRLGL